MISQKIGGISLADVQGVEDALDDHVEEPLTEDLLEAIDRIADQLYKDEHQTPGMRLFNDQTFHNHSIASHKKT